MAALTAIAALVLAGCGGGQPESGPPDPDVDFEEPQANATVSNPVTVKMSAEVITIEQAGAVREGAGHFHIMVDTPCVAPGQIIPEDDSHKHYGQAQTETVLELPPGQHVLCLQVGDGAHTALPITEMMTITVE
ncbi:MAG: DUF4399 domain-containing protein [Egibacteraceae bacterium]